MTEEYVLLPGDLRESELIVREVQQTGLKPDVPTLILAECVLVYMPPEDSQALVSKLGSLCSPAAFVIYEQVKFCLAQGIRHFHIRGAKLETSKPWIRFAVDYIMSWGIQVGSGWGIQSHSACRIFCLLSSSE